MVIHKILTHINVRCFYLQLHLLCPKQRVLLVSLES